MPLFELVIALLLAGAVLSAWARRISVPYPALLALAGAGLALLPHVPSVTLDPELALALFVAPVLLDAAFDSSPRDLKRYWRAVVGLAVAAVAVTIGAVAVVARLCVPGLPWPAAIALGAIVAPPDAAAATAVLKQMRPPHRLLVILEGESLFNDASALLVYRLAVGAAAAGSFSPWSALPLLAIVSVGSVLLAAVLSRLTLFVVGRVRDVATSVIIQFLMTFGVWILAERLRLSSIITIVSYAILTARSAPARMPARLRIPSYAVWEVVVFVLNVLAFILVGLQLRPILQRLDRPQLLDYVATAAAVCAAAIVVRMLWALAYAVVARWTRRGDPSDAQLAPRASLRSAIAIGWSGMRGIVTLAAGLALPAAFPARDLVLFTAFCVVLVTLVLQGGTLAPLMRLLRLEDDGTIEGEIQRARAETARAGLEALQGTGENGMTALLTRKYEARLRRADGAGPTTAGDMDDLPRYAEALRHAHEAERRKLLELRARDVIGDDAFHRVEEELDWADLHEEAQRGTV
ncbi:MAG TPA: cation:proton antiporter [Myxococcales bacterium]